MKKGIGLLWGELALASCNWPHQHRKHVGRLLSRFKASVCKVIKSPKASANSSFTAGPSYVSVPFSSVAADECELGTWSITELATTVNGAQRAYTKMEDIEIHQKEINVFTQ